MPLAKIEKCKPLLIEIQTQTDLLEVETSKVITTTDSMDIVKIVGQTFCTSIAELQPTNVIEILVDSIKKIIECNAQSYKATDDTIPILRLVAPKCIVDNKDSLGQLDTLSKFITGNILTVDQINEDTFKERMNKEKEKFFEEIVKKNKEQIETLLPALRETILDFKKLYRDTCKTNILTEDLDKEISKAQDEINNIADNLIGTLDSFLEIEKKIVDLEDKIEKLEKDKERIKDKAKSLKCKLGPKLDYLISLRKEISEALVPGLKTPEEKMYILTSIVQRTQEALQDSKRFSGSLNLVLTDIL